MAVKVRLIQLDDGKVLATTLPDMYLAPDEVGRPFIEVVVDRKGRVRPKGGVKLSEKAKYAARLATRIVVGSGFVFEDK